jgi:TolB-like protein/Flp pilus assembly protein TadD
MKRCPACKRVENDDTLIFCRADGTALVSDSGSVSGDAGTAKFGTAPAASEAATSALPQHATDAGISRSTGSTTVLDPQQPISTTRALGRPKRTKAIVFVGAAILMIAVAIAVSVYFFVSRRNNAAIQSIAVLPFVNESGNSDVEYLSDGMTESLISSLSQIPKLNVKARSSVFRYKGKDTNAGTIGKELNVQAILNGRVVQHGQDLILYVELVDTATENVLWKQTYNKTLTNLVALQNDIARDVADKLKVKLSGADEQKLAKHYTDNPEAYQLYLKGRFYWNQRTGEALKKSIEYFNQAIEKDPSYALAYSGLADSYVLLPNFAGGLPRETFPKAKASAKRALELDETLADAHVPLAVALYRFDWNFSEAEAEFQRAIELNPNYATAHQFYGEYLGTVGRFENGIAELKRAQELDPLSLIINADLGKAYFYARSYDQAVEQMRKTIEMDQSFFTAHFYLGMVYVMKGSFPNAITEYQRAKQLNDDPRMLGLLGHVYGVSGQRGEALRMLDQLKENAGQRYVSAYSFALVYAGLGEKDRAFEWLEKSYQDHTPYLSTIKVDPLLDNLRSDPRFAELMRRVGLPQ